MPVPDPLAADYVRPMTFPGLEGRTIVVTGAGGGQGAAEARLLAAAQEAADQEASDARRSQIRTVDRSERVRTYNFPENRFSDHRVGYKAHNLDQVLGGELEPVIKALTDADLAARLEAVESQ